MIVCQVFYGCVRQLCYVRMSIKLFSEKNTYKIIWDLIISLVEYK